MIVESELWAKYIHIVKAMVFPVMYGCKSWTINKAEPQRNGAFKLWCWRRLLRVAWTARRSNQSILKEISPEIHWKDWCWSWNSILWLPNVKSQLTGKDPDAGKDWGQEEKGETEDEAVGWHHWLNGHEFEWTTGDSEGQGSLACGTQSTILTALGLPENCLSTFYQNNP